MQDALGADFTDFNRIAQPFASDADTAHRLHFNPGSSFTPLLQETPRHADALDCVAHGRRLRAPGSPGDSCRIVKLHWRNRQVSACGKVRLILGEERDDRSGTARIPFDPAFAVRQKAGGLEAVAKI